MISRSRRMKERATIIVEFINMWVRTADTCRLESRNHIVGCKAVYIYSSTTFESLLSGLIYSMSLSLYIVSDAEFSSKMCHKSILKIIDMSHSNIKEISTSDESIHALYSRR